MSECQSICPGCGCGRKRVVYIASPYTQGHKNRNVKLACEAWETIRADGVVVPICPLWSDLQDRVHPLSWEEWLEYDLDLFRSGVVHAVYRLPSDTPSSGVEREVEEATRLGIPVFDSLDDVYGWARAAR